MDAVVAACLALLFLNGRCGVQRHKARLQVARHGTRSANTSRPRLACRVAPPPTSSCKPSCALLG